MLRFRAAIFVFCLFVVSALWSQTATGRIVGTVSDPTGALIPGASITVTNVNTQVAYDTLTNEQGLYQAPLLPIGTYTVTANMPGFQKAVTKPEKLEINQSLRVDIKMVVGARSDEVIVEEGITHVETVTPTLGASITSNQIATMPLNGRNTLDLALLQPGVIPISSTAGGNTGTFSVAGARQDSVTYLLDGGVNNNLLSNGVVLNPNPDMVEEFRILTSTYNAEYGRNAGGIVSVVTKSGTNTFHGTAYDYLRNEALNANAFFNNASGLPKDILKRNQFGGTLGGPVLKDKLFFFSGWQSQRQSQLRTTPKLTVFTPAELNGDFSQSNSTRTGPDANVAAFLQQFPYYQPNPALAAQAIIDPSKISTVARNYTKAGLMPSDPSGFKTFQDSARDNRDELTNKIDYYLSSKDRVSATLGWNRQNQLNPYSSTTLSVGGFGSNTLTNRYFLGLNWVRTFSPSLLNDFRLTGQRNNNYQAVPARKLPTPNELGIGIISDDPTGPTILDFSSGFRVGFSNQGPTKLIDNTFFWNDSLTWIKSAHTFKAGGSYTPYQNNTLYDFYINGQFFFVDVGGGSGPYSRNDRADFILGLPDEFLQYPAAPSNIRSKNFSGFFQDEWKIRRNLALTLGVRYEYNSPKLDLQGRSFTWAFGQQSTVFPNAPKGILFPGDANAPKGSNFPDKNDWAPRIGFAWSPGTSGKTSVRGGFGVFYDILKAEDNLQFNGQAPFFAFADLFFPALNANPTAEPPNMTRPFVAAGQNNPFPSAPPPKNLDFARAGFLPLGGGGVYSVDPNLRTPYVYQFNLDIQREISSYTIFDIAYAGSSSHKLTGLYDSNPFIPGQTLRRFNQTPGNPTNAFNYLDTFANVGNANYHSLELGVRGRPRDVRHVGNLSYQFSYTYGKSEDTTSGFRARNSRVPYFDQKRFKAVSDYDLTHYVSISGSWGLPSPKNWGGGPGLLFSGWTLQPILSHRNGEPLDVLAGLTRNRTNPGPSAAGDQTLVRANQVAPVTYFDPRVSQTFNGRTGNYYFDPNAFSRTALLATAAQGFDPVNNPSQRTYGNFGRNGIRGPSRTSLDLSIAKRTNIDETRILEFRADMFNALNHPLFRNPETQSNRTTFGQISQTGTIVQGITDPQTRVIQFALKLIF
jgi:Carboxypeptidase regulatory-like domain/TonB-dependent Receptor Plug Domain